MDINGSMYVCSKLILLQCELGSKVRLCGGWGGVWAEGNPPYSRCLVLCILSLLTIPCSVWDVNAFGIVGLDICEDGIYIIATTTFTMGVPMKLTPTSQHRWSGRWIGWPRRPWWSWGRLHMGAGSGWWGLRQQRFEWPPCHWDNGTAIDGGGAGSPPSFTTAYDEQLWHYHPLYTWLHGGSTFSTAIHNYSYLSIFVSLSLFTACIYVYTCNKMYIGSNRQAEIRAP